MTDLIKKYGLEDLDFYELRTLSKAIVKRARAKQAEVAQTFEVGMRVFFVCTQRGKEGIRTGTVTKINRSTVVIDCEEDGKVWTVHSTLLKKLADEEGIVFED